MTGCDDLDGQPALTTSRETQSDLLGIQISELYFDELSPDVEDDPNER